MTENLILLRFISLHPVPLRRVVLLCLLAGTARAQTAPPDSARLSQRQHRLGEVQVRAVGPERFAVGSTRLELDSATLAQYRGGNLADVLQARTPLALKYYGPGQLATIALRGTSAQHTAVLWNGLNIMLPTLGQNDFSLLTVGASTSVAIQPGPAAALYGSGAVGGAVLLNAAPDWRPGLRGSVQADAGSFGLAGGSVEARAASSNVAVRVAASYREAQNNYTYLLQEARGPVRYTLQNAALRHQWSISPDVAWRLGQAGELTAAAWLTDVDREIQSGVNIIGTQARERDQSRRFTLGYRHVGARQQWAVRGAWFEDILNYRDGGAPSNSRVRTTQAQAERTTALGARGSLRLGAEAQHFAAQVDGYGTAEIGENRAAAFALLRYDPRPALRLSANLRQAVLPAGLAPLTPTLGLEWDLLAVPDSAQALTLKASAARSYRAPTLNERYWLPGGNPELRPESGVGYEGGLRHRRAWGRRWTLESELTAFRQDVDDWVQWLPESSTGIWSPRNLRRVRSQGLEANTALRLRQGRYTGRVQVAYHYTDTRKTQGSAADSDPVGVQLAYVPPHQASFGADQQWRGWQLSTTLVFTSYRFTNASGTDFLPGTRLLSATLGRTIQGPAHTSLLVLLQASNLLNQAYFSYPGRPAPPRAIGASLRLGWR
ncbi:TonB-dependent receptor [Hymenobacter properus]|uniref:TonB-dependent receptor n=1 Tax=Hymenobacter properus TaxID=2791026 RepID=A0A931BMX8_9BACT|nr:TonB-dependent receptor [Hymenobacter properus]MBF9143223.1 TonB-dependent receptor [Hymenobacter properus]MBR7722032.1 TonB-dependent receptor [Microvirga sp. SRT04]